jgi:hypothetical protein
MKNQGVTSDYIREIRQLGFVPDGDQWVQMRNRGITVDDAREMRQMNPSASIQDLLTRMPKALPDRKRNVGQTSFNYPGSKATPSGDAHRSWAIEWPALTGPNRSPAPDRIQLVFFNVGGITSNAFEFDASVFRGLNPSQMTAPVRTAVRFDIVREAGTFACEGSFQAGRGTGTFVFQPNPEFRGQMMTLGLLDLDDRQFQEMAMVEVGPRYVAELRAAGLTVPTVSQLMEMRMQGLSAEYIREIQTLGFNPRGSEWMTLRVQGVRADFAREVLKTYPSATVRDLVDLKIQGFGKK